MVLKYASIEKKVWDTEDTISSHGRFIIPISVFEASKKSDNNDIFSTLTQNFPYLTMKYFLICNVY